LSKPAKQPEAVVTTDQLARDLIDAAATIEDIAGQAVRQIEATFMPYAKALRARGEAILRNDPDAYFID